MTPRTLKLADGLALPADEAVTQKYGFIGRSGSGKSYASMRLAELFLGAGAQIIALDWVGIDTAVLSYVKKHAGTRLGGILEALSMKSWTLRAALDRLVASKQIVITGVGRGQRVNAKEGL